MIRSMVLWVGMLGFCTFARNIIGDTSVLINLKSFSLVFFGALVGGVLSIPVDTFAGFGHNMAASLKRQKREPEALIQQIVAIARIHRLMDIRELTKRYRTLQNPFLRRGLLQLLDHNDRLRIEETMEKEISLYLSRLQSQLAAVQHFAKLAPVFGFVGTIVGLINVLNHMGDATQIGQGMAISLLTTFYGLLVANFIFTPLAGRLAAYIQRETLILNIVIEGVLAIFDKCTSVEISHLLLSYVETDGMITHAVGSSKPFGIWQKWSSMMKTNGLVR